MADLPPDGFGRRKCPRLNVAPGLISARIDGEFACRVTNISQGGVFLRTGARFRPGSLVKLDITHANRRLRCDCRVAHARRQGIGIEFLRPGETFLKLLNEVLDSLISAGAQFERRRETRVNVAETITWEWQDEHTESKLGDLSIGGAMMLHDSPPPVGSIIVVLLPVYATAGNRDPEDFSRCEAEVLRHKGQGFAVSFRRPSSAFNMALANLLSAALVAARSDDGNNDR